MSVFFQSIPTTEDDSLENNFPIIIISSPSTPLMKINKNQDYPNCFPADIWRLIINYLTFIQITHLAQCNRFFYSFCRPILKKFIANGAIYIKITSKKMNVQLTETDIEKLGPQKILHLLRYEIDCWHRFPASQIFLEQDPTFFSQPWTLYWDSLFRHCSPGTQFLEELSLRNIHCSKSEFLKFITPCGRLKKLILNSCSFNENIYIEADIYDQNSALRILQISKCPAIICDKNSKKYFLKTQQHLEQDSTFFSLPWTLFRDKWNIYDRNHAFSRESQNQIPSKTIYNFDKAGLNFFQLLSILFPAFHCCFLWIFYLSKFNQKFYHFIVVLPTCLFISMTLFIRFSSLYNSSKFRILRKIECFMQDSVFPRMSSSQKIFCHFVYANAFFFIIIYISSIFHSPAKTEQIIDQLFIRSIVAGVIILYGFIILFTWFWSYMFTSTSKTLIKYFSVFFIVLIILVMI